MILPALLEDKGRARAMTLLSILGTGPDYFSQRIPDIDAALGNLSPGIGGLRELVQRLEDASSTSRPKVPKQHVITQRLLEEFTEIVDPKAGLQLVRFNLKYGAPTLTGTGGAGYVRDFVAIDSQATESIWKSVEDHLPEVIDTAKSGVPTTDPELLELLRNTIALHFVRNPQTRDVHENSFELAYANSVARWSSTPWGAEAFRREYGLIPAGPEAMRMGAEAAMRRLRERADDGVLFRLTVQRMFEAVCDRVEIRDVEILIPANNDKEFLIGDVPALTINFASGAAGLAQHVTVDEADAIVLPLGPRVLASLGANSGVRTIDDTEVDHFNALQVRAAATYVHYRPGADFQANVMVWRSMESTTSAAEPDWLERCGVTFVNL